jgi:F-type H+-transporting ATPase subunit b
MNITATLIGQSVTFFIFVWFCMKFVWPPIMAALHERKTKIADGLAAAERGEHEQKLAQERATEMLHEAKNKASEIIAKAETRAAEIVEESKDDARTEGERILNAARAEVDQEVNRAREALKSEIAGIVVAGASKVLEREVDAKSHDDLLNSLVAEL